MVLPGSPDVFSAALRSPWQRRRPGLWPTGTQSRGEANDAGTRSARLATPAEPMGPLVLPDSPDDSATAWRMKEIDEMNMLGFLRLRAWDATREQEKKKPRQRFIDEVWPGVKPG